MQKMAQNDMKTQIYPCIHEFHEWVLSLFWYFLGVLKGVASLEEGQKCPKKRKLALLTGHGKLKE
jgi:hypothetical protein